MLHRNVATLLLSVVSFACLALPGVLCAEEARPKSDDEIRKILIDESKAAYTGSCRCPFDVSPAGGKCGDSSDYSRPGGAAPLCFPNDVKQPDIDAYRAAHPETAK